MNWKNEFTDLFRVRYPFVQAPMLGVSTPEMAAAVSNAGGLGSLAIGGLSPEKCRELIRATRKLTNKPFFVNFFAHDVPPRPSEDSIAKMQKLLLELAQKAGIAIDMSDLSDFPFYTYRDQLDVLIEEKIKLVSFTFGVPDEEFIQELKDRECILAGTATCLQEAKIIEASGIDAVVAQGSEAGGHRGSFLNQAPISQIGLFSLLPALSENIRMPVVAAGGIFDPRTFKAAMDLGAMAGQLGTPFIACKESAAIESYKKLAGTIPDTEVILTREFSGRWARGISNEFIQYIRESGLEILPYPYQNSLTGKLRKLAQQSNNTQYTNLWCGQSSKEQFRGKAAAEIMRYILSETEER